MKTTLPIPIDNRLDGLQHLLDVDAVRRLLNEAGAEVENGHGFYLRYKPGASCIAAYQFERKNPESGEAEPAFFYGKCSTPEAFSIAIQKAQTHRWVQPPSGPPVVPDHESSTLFYAFPNDPGLTGLRLLQTPEKLRRFLQQYLPQHTSESWRLSRTRLTNQVVRYKPGRRAVFALKTKAINLETNEREAVRLYWRVCQDNQVEEVFRTMRRLREHFKTVSGVNVPRPLGTDPKGRVLVMEEMPGQSLTEILESGLANTAVERTGAALAQLHNMEDKNLSLRTPEDFLEQASEAKNMLAALSPEYLDSAHRILARLRRNTPAPASALGFVHGDFHYGQVLVGEGVGLLDFDRSYTGCRLADLGNFKAHLKLLSLENRVTNDEEMDRCFLEGYTSVWKQTPPEGALRWWTALSLVFLAVGPFRRLEPRWPEMVQAILSAAEDELC